MFSKYPQKSTGKTCTLVYHATYKNVNELLGCLDGAPTKKPIVTRIVKQIQSIDPDCTIFNWECCSAEESKMFPLDGSTQKAIKALLDKGHMVMFSDWSLKALIKNWDEKSLGLNPFIHVKDYSGSLKLGFDKKKLLTCPSTQLHILAEISKTDHCEIKAPEKTIVYTLN